MPLWLWLAGGAAALWWLNSRQKVQVAIAPGAAAYKVGSEGADWFSSDPSLGSGQSGVPLTKGGTLSAGTVVYSTTSGSPKLSADSAYELVLAPGVGQVWVSIASILAQ